MNQFTKVILFCVILNCELLRAADAPQAQVTVVSPDSALPSVVTIDQVDCKFAAKDLCDYLSRVSGRQIAVSDKPAEQGVIIHVGADPFVREHVSDLNTVRGDGFIVKYVETDGRQHLILTGKQDLAAQWAVEQFLHDACGVRWLMPDPENGEVVPSKPLIQINSNLASRYEPDYLTRSNVGMYFYNPGKRFLRLHAHGYQFGDHAIQWMFTGDDFKAHPEWFALANGKRQWWTVGNGWQICTSNPETIDHAMQYIAKYFKDYPNAPIVSIGPNDGSGWCECDKCKAFMNSASPPYTVSERWFDWVNRVAVRAAKLYPDKKVESLAYAETSDLPRFNLEPNVAVTKTIVVDRELKQAEDWGQRAKSVNLYSYMYGRSFLGFRHYPHAARDFLKWGHDTLGAIAHVTEGGGDWSFDGPKFYYLQALQWDVNADPDAIMREYCDASYGAAAAPMLEFWNRMEQIYERRAAIEFGRTKRRLLFYQWVSWSAGNGPPDDELLDYSEDDLAFVDGCFERASAKLAAADVHERFRMERVQDAWRYFRTIVKSHLITRTLRRDDGKLDIARQLAALAAERDRCLRALCAYPLVNPRMVHDANYYYAYTDGMTVFTREQSAIDALCASHDDALAKSQGRAAADVFWKSITRDDPLYTAAQTQLQRIAHPDSINLLKNGGFEDPMGPEWIVKSGSAKQSTEVAHGGKHSVVLDGETLNFKQSIAIQPLERYALSMQVQTLSTIPETPSPPAARVAFFYNDLALYEAPANLVVIPSHKVHDGWTTVRMTTTAPPHANRAEVSFAMYSAGSLAVDDVRFESIFPTPAGNSNQLAENFDDATISPGRWTHQPDGVGAKPPRVANGWLIFDDPGMFTLTAVPTFEKLLSEEGASRYRLRIHAAALDGEDPNAMMALEIGNQTTQPLSRFMFYHCFRAANETAPQLKVFCNNQGTQTLSTGWPLKGFGSKTDVWYTFVFSSRSIDIYASPDSFDQSDARHVATVEHGITKLDSGGPPVLQLDHGKYRVDQVIVDRLDGAKSVADQPKQDAAQPGPAQNVLPPEPIPPKNGDSHR